MTAPPEGARVSLEAPAKLNLGLRIVGRRADGYHLLESLFVPIDWSDRLGVTIEPGPSEDVSLRLETEGPASAPADASNLAARAAAVWMAEARWSGRIEIRLEKSLPSGAGLGGGSSDAAAVLRALERLAPGVLPAGRLAALALSLGADVPFFLDPRPALVTGIGERIEPVAGWPGLWITLANPGISLATAAVYDAWDRSEAALTPVRAGSTMRALSRLRDAPAPTSELLSKLLVNDLEPAASGLCPGVADLQRQLRSLGALATGMSGSGATVFGVFAEEGRARRAAEAMEESGRSPIGADPGTSSSRPRSSTSIPSSGTSSSRSGTSRVWARVVRSAESGPESGSGASPNW